MERRNADGHHPGLLGLNTPSGVAVDSSGNVYIADTDNKAIKEWNASTQTVSTLVSSGLHQPRGVAVDGSGNVYIADTGNNAIEEWNAATQTVSTLVSSGIESAEWRGGGQHGQRLHRRYTTTRSRSCRGRSCRAASSAKGRRRGRISCWPSCPPPSR